MIMIQDDIVPSNTPSQQQWRRQLDELATTEAAAAKEPKVARKAEKASRAPKG